MCQHTSSLLNSHNDKMQSCINKAHQKGQLSSTLGVPQSRQLESFYRADGHGLHTVNGELGGILDRLFLHATRVGWNPDGAAPKGRWLSRITRAWESWWLEVWGWHICLSWTFSVTQSKGHSGLAAFHGTSYGTCGWEGVGAGGPREEGVGARGREKESEPGTREKKESEPGSERRRSRSRGPREEGVRAGDPRGVGACGSREEGVGAGGPRERSRSRGPESRSWIRGPKEEGVGAGAREKREVARIRGRRGVGIRLTENKTQWFL